MKKAISVFLAIGIFLGIVLGGQYVVSSLNKKFVIDDITESLTIDKNIPTEWQNIVYPENKVVEVRIYIEESQREYMNEHAMEELYVPANVVYNGVYIENIGIRPKGNSSLMTAFMSGDNQYSFKLSIDEYVDQDFYGLSTINLNNLTMDPTYIREPLGYELMEYMGIPTPQTTFCNVYMNDELVGLYLSVQQIDEKMTKAWFENGEGEIYKPDGTGADLVYIDDNYDSYSGMIEKTNVSKEEEESLVHMIDVINNGGDIEEVLDVDMVLKYNAVNTTIINLDNYAGGMFHNYYLYGEDGKYMVLPWDYNMTFMPFSMMGDKDMDVVEFLIDEPTAGAMENYPLINALLTNEKYLNQYHEYIEELLNGPLNVEQFTERVYELYELIDPYILADPNPQNTYENFIGGLYDDYNYNINKDEPLYLKEKTDESDTANSKSLKDFSMGPMGANAPALIDFISERTDNVWKQLSGEIASTNEGQGNGTGIQNKMGGFGEGGLNITEMMKGKNMEVIRKQMENIDMEAMQKQMENIDLENMDMEAMKEQMKDGGGLPFMPGGDNEDSMAKMSIPEGMSIFDMGTMILGEENMNSIYSALTSLVIILAALIFRRKKYI
jgi:spore coat protein CotH